MDDIEATNVLLTVNNNTNTTHVTTTGDHDKVAGLELDEVGYLSSLKLVLHSVVDGNQRIGVADGTSIVRGDVRDTLGANSSLPDLKELVGGFLSGDAVDGETALDVVQETEVLAGLLNGDNILNYDKLDQILRRRDINVPMKPAGKVGSVLTFWSTLIKRCIVIERTSLPVKAYFSLLRRKMVRGRDSRSLWGPGEGRGAYRTANCQLRCCADKIFCKTHVGTAQLVEHP